MTPPSPYRGTSWGSTLMSLPRKGKVKIINVGPIDGLAGGRGGFQCWFLDECSPKGIMNSYSEARPKRKTAWVLFPWKGWSKSADEPGSFFPLFLQHITLFSFSHTRASLTYTHVWIHFPKSISVFHFSATQTSAYMHHLLLTFTGRSEPRHHGSKTP